MKRRPSFNCTENGSADGISMPTKLTQLRYSGYSAEFLDRVEPNGNIPSKNGGSTNAGKILIKQSWIFAGRFSSSIPYAHHDNLLFGILA